MSIETELDEFAKSVALEAKAKSVTITERIDALKALTAYYAARQKHVKKDPDEGEDDGFSFAQEPRNGRNPKLPGN